MLTNVSRREFLRLSALAAAGIAAVACAGTPAPTATTEPETKPQEQAATATPQAAAATATPKPAEPTTNEPPALADMVQAGQIPPLNERLPEDVMVVGSGVLIPADFMNWEVGTYGGTMRYCTARTDVCAELWDASAEPPLITPGKLVAASLGDITPNLIKSFELGADQQSITFHMRKGAKWSDGEPCTTGDVQFWYNDVLLNEEITPTPSKVYKAGGLADGNMMQLEVIDDYTFKVSFDAPGMALMSNISSYSNNFHALMRPAHYMKQFHKNYANAEDLKKELDEAKLPEAEWFRLFTQKDESTLTWVLLQALDTGYPRLNPWLLDNLGSGVSTWARNPYYWKADTAGNQLPYIDQIRIEMVSNSETVTMKILAGEVDWAREYATMMNYPLYKENEAKAGLRVQIWDTFVAPLQIRFNFTYPDETWQKTVRDVRFRKALNMAIDHQKVVDSVYQGFGTPPTEITGLSYDPEGAKKLLDEMGMDQMDADGYRIGLDGKTFVFPLEVQKGYTPEQDAICELLVEYWKDIGIKTDFKNVEATLYTTRNTNNDLLISMQWAHTGFWRDAPRTSDYQPGTARLWQLWNDTQGQEGEEPEPWAKRLYEIGNIADSMVLSDADTQAIHNEMWQILKEQVPFVMPIDHAVLPMLGSAKLANVPNKGWGTIASFTQEDFFFKS
jgi:peptide/nickel transport system substrate-binding protein